MNLTYGIRKDNLEIAMVTFGNEKAFTFKDAKF